PGLRIPFRQARLQNGQSARCAAPGMFPPHSGQDWALAGASACAQRLRDCPALASHRGGMHCSRVPALKGDETAMARVFHALSDAMGRPAVVALAAALVLTAPAASAVAQVRGPDQIADV